MTDHPSELETWTDYQDDISDAISDSMDMDWSANDGARAVVAWLNKHRPLSAAPATEGGAVWFGVTGAADETEALAVALFDARCPGIRMEDEDLHYYRAAAQRAMRAVADELDTPALATREEAPAEVGEQWLWRVPGRGWVLCDREDDVVREVRVEGEYVETEVVALSALRAQPPAREDAQPVAWRWKTPIQHVGDGTRWGWSFASHPSTPPASINPEPLYTRPAPDALLVAVEALKAIKALGLGPDRGAANWRAEQAPEIATKALAALQAEQGAK